MLLITLSGAIIKTFDTSNESNNRSLIAVRLMIVLPNLSPYQVEWQIQACLLYS